MVLLKGGPMNKVAFALVATLLAGCSGSESPGAATPSASAVEGNSSPSATPTLEELPTSEGRLEGKYNVKLFTTSNTFDSKPAKNQAFRFEPKCGTGACDTALTGRMVFEGAGSEDRKQAGAEASFSVTLRSFGKKYEGFDTDFFASCGTEPDKDRWTFNLTVDKAVYVGEVWTAQKWSGTWTRAALGSGGVCTPGRLKAVIRGTRKEG
jgi:hypothetical protein